MGSREAGTRAFGAFEALLERSLSSAFALSIGDFVYNSLLALGAIVIARLLGPEGNGIYSLALSVPLTVYALTNLSIDVGTTRYVRLYVTEERGGDVLNIAAASLIVRTLTGTACTIACFLFADQLSLLLTKRLEIGPYVRLASITILLQSLYTVLLGLFLGLGMPWKIASLKIVYGAGKMLIAVPLILAGANVGGAVVGYVAAFGVSTALGLTYALVALRKLRSPKARGDLGLYRALTALIGYSLPLFVGSLAGTLSGAYQTVLMAYTLSEAEIGSFRALTNLLNLITVVTNPLAATFLSMFTELVANKNSREGDREGLKLALKLSNKYVSAVVLPLTLICMLYSREIVQVIYGARYVWAYIYLPVMVAPFMFCGLGSITIPALLGGIGMTKTNMIVALASSTTFVAISFLLTYFMGLRLWGILLASLASSAISVALYNISLSKALGCNLKYSEEVRCYAIAALTLPVAVFFLAMPMPRPTALLRLLCGSLVYALAYFTALAHAGILSESDMRILTRVFSRFPPLSYVATMILQIVRGLLRLFAKFKGGLWQTSEPS